MTESLKLAAQVKTHHKNMREYVRLSQEWLKSCEVFIGREMCEPVKNHSFLFFAFIFCFY